MNPFAQIAFGAVISFIAVTFIFFFIFLLCKSKPTSRTRRLDPHTDRPNLGTRELSSITADESASFDPSLRQVSMSKVILATNNFDPKGIIGDGSFGLVYKAELSAGVTVALKKLSPDAFQGLREFRAEMETLGKLRHPNIVRILGYCVSGPDRILIYEFVEKGSLDQWLHETSDDSSSSSPGPGSGSGSGSGSTTCGVWPLTWETKLKIIGGVANGLAFMHGLETPIIHRDIKASNVLLDSEFEAHIADFGLARRIEGSHSHVSTQVAGTMGYMPPEYKAGFTAATVKADVYSFGVLMFEVATGKRPNWPVRDDGREVCLVEWVKKRMAENRVLEVVQSVPTAKGEEQGLCSRASEVSGFLRVADLCTSEDHRLRPCMSQVVHLLNQITSS